MIAQESTNIGERHIHCWDALVAFLSEHLKTEDGTEESVKEIDTYIKWMQTVCVHDRRGGVALFGQDHLQQRQCQIRSHLSGPEHKRTDQQRVHETIFQEVHGNRQANGSEPKGDFERNLQAHLGATGKSTGRPSQRTM